MDIIFELIKAVITLVFGGIIGYFIKARIDKSVFQDQTRFVRNHSKTVEALETIYQKYSGIVTESKLVIHDIVWKDLQGEHRARNLRKALEDLSTNFQNNRHYLNEKSRDIINNNIEKLKSLIIIIDSLEELKFAPDEFWEQDDGESKYASKLFINIVIKKELEAEDIEPINTEDKFYYHRTLESVNKVLSSNLDVMANHYREIAGLEKE
jgi:uncharacterized protein YneF (UPF0154 family)